MIYTKSVENRDEKEADMKKFIECACCEQYHHADFYGDCRDDANRFDSEDLDNKYGAFGWEIVSEDIDEGGK